VPVLEFEGYTFFDMNRLRANEPVAGNPLLSAEQLAYFDSSEGREENERLADYLLSLAGSIDPAELEAIPTDLSRQVDHYLHGCPRQPD
jgi:hypothetical protein